MGSLPQGYPVAVECFIQPVETIYGLAGRPVCLAFSPNSRLLGLEAMEYAFRIYELPP